VGNKGLESINKTISYRLSKSLKNGVPEKEFGVYGP
jgi:hypothetical protein